MKDIFNRRQRFSLRKYSIGVCSVLLGTALFAAGAELNLRQRMKQQQPLQVHQRQLRRSLHLIAQ